MAKTGWIDLICGTQDVANNTSPVKVTGKIKTSGDSYRGSHRTGTYYVYQGGVLIKSDTFTSGAPANSETTLFSIDITVNHASDGTSGAITASYTYDGGWCSGSGSLTLPTIPRASSISGIGGNTIGSQMQIYIDRKSTAFTHDIYYKLGDSGWYLAADNVTDSAKFTLDMALCSQLPKATSGTLTLLLRTFNGSTQIGSDVTDTTKVYVPDSVVPSVSMELSDPSGYLSTYGKYVQNRSQVAVEISNAGSYGSSIVARITKLNGSNYTSQAEFTINPISLSGTVTLQTTVTDSRGRTATDSKSIEVLAYSLPSINKISAVRCNSDGTTNSSGAYLKVSFDAVVSSIGTASYKLQYKKTTDTSYTSVTLSDYANKYSVSGGYYVFSADTGSSYDIDLIAYDAFTSTKRTTKGSSIKKLWSILKKAFGIALGKVAELENTFEVALDAKFNGAVYGSAMGLKELPLIPNGADLNDYTSVGCYAISDSSHMSGIANVPDTPYAGRLIVASANGINTDAGVDTNVYLHQTYIPAIASEPNFERHVYKEKNTWVYSDWVMIDKIVESGISGIWYYKKMASGLAKCWTTGMKTITGTATVSLMGGYYSYASPTLPFTFTTIYHIDPVARLGSGVGWAYASSGSTYVTIYCVGNQNSTTINYTCTVEGRWK